MGAKLDENIEALIDAAISILHHDIDEDHESGKHEKRCLERAFRKILEP